MHRLAFAVALSALTSSLAVADTIRVEWDGSGDVVTIQDAILAASDGDTILIGPGTYTWDQQNTDGYPQRFRGMIQLAKDLYPSRPNAPNDLVIIGTAGPEQTVIDAQDNNRVFYTSGDTAQGDGVALRFTVEGVTFRNGNNADQPVETNQWGAGAATHLASPTFRNCHFVSNHAVTGGGIWTGGQNFALLENCVFRDNTAEFGGGAAAVNSSLYMVSYRDCLFEDNSATTSGGAFYSFNSQVTMERVVMFRNHADARGSGIRGFWTRPLILRGMFVFRGSGANAAVDVDYAQIEGVERPINASVLEIHNTLVARNDNVGIRIGSRVNATVTCTNSHEHDRYNWMERAGPFSRINGNGSFDPQFCIGQARDAIVCDASPMLAEINLECDENIGNVTTGCSGCEVTDYPPTGGGSAVTVLPSYPNPFRDTATLEFDLERTEHVKIAVYDLKGRRVRLLLDENRDPGPNVAMWDGCDDSGRRLASGVYLCEFKAGDKSSRGPMVLLN